MCNPYVCVSLHHSPIAVTKKVVSSPVLIHPLCKHLVPKLRTAKGHRSNLSVAVCKLVPNKGGKCTTKRVSHKNKFIVVVFMEEIFHSGDGVLVHLDGTVVEPLVDRASSAALVGREVSLSSFPSFP